ncbi:uncharacterized protein LOC135496995 [Lineus longissimus]|uniref:uncharacterized protein LOC135496995 n=1 Tax=Lineus longissimus TaxID=88925 RepID=UPI002B4C94D9
MVQGMQQTGQILFLFVAMVVVFGPNLSSPFLFSTSKSKLEQYQKVIHGNYGNWCGKKNTWLRIKNSNGCCGCGESVAKCRRCMRPIDDLDDACLQHDFCVHCNRTGVKFQHFCECEELVSHLAQRAYCAEGSFSVCGIYRTALRGLFKRIPCVCRKKDSCDASIIGWKTFQNRPTPCVKSNYHQCLH